MTREERTAVVLRTLVVRMIMRSSGATHSFAEVMTTIAMMKKLKPKVLQEMIQDAESIVIALGD